ncbi:Transposable element Tc1 transposase [Araneus ventricosus]|uniref:Transposable element Tc1 transposase n=1 Tax=Araneus ventricosus TaxID=182803 RepID=A0A4Y2M1V7_ARAVE|nr:Transposable element Tc1 transposase [Araneus ventricosus]
MARSHKETTISIRKLIIFHHSSGKSVRNIAKLVNLSNSTVQYVLKRFKEENWIGNKVRKGRPAKLTKRDQRFIIRKFVKNPRLSALKVSAEFNEKFSTSILPETVRRVLGTAGLNGRSARRKFFVSVKNRKLRLSFAKSMLNNLETYWNNVLFVDESKFNIFGSDGRIMVWRRKNEELNPKNLDGTINYGRGSVLVWGCMSTSGLDNDPKPTVLNIRLRCLYNCPQNLKTPQQSRDLNPIEHIWRELENRITGWQVTLSAFLHLVPELFEKMKFVLHSRFNQDALENYFSQVRRKGGSNDHLSPVDFLQRTRMLLAEMFVMCGSANCEPNDDIILEFLKY